VVFQSKSAGTTRSLVFSIFSGSYTSVSQALNSVIILAANKSFRYLFILQSCCFVGIRCKDTNIILIMYLKSCIIYPVYFLFNNLCGCMPYMGSYNIQVLSYAYNALSWGCTGLFFYYFSVVAEIT